MPSNVFARRRRRRPARQPQAARPAASQVPRLLAEIAVACEVPGGELRQVWAAFLRSHSPHVTGFRVDVLLGSERGQTLTDFLLHQGSPHRFVTLLESLVAEGFLTRGTTTRFTENLLALVDAHGDWKRVPLHAHIPEGETP